MNSRTSLGLLCLAFGGACAPDHGDSQTSRFTFDAISIDERPCPCLIVVDDDWHAAMERQQFVNVAADDELALELPPTGGPWTITAAPISVQEGRAVRLPRSRKEAMDLSGFKDEVRVVHARDPRRHLFILSRRPS